MTVVFSHHGFHLYATPIDELVSLVAASVSLYLCITGCTGCCDVIVALLFWGAADAMPRVELTSWGSLRGRRRGELTQRHEQVRPGKSRLPLLGLWSDLSATRKSRVAAA